MQAGPLLRRAEPKPGLLPSTPRRPLRRRGRVP